MTYILMLYTVVALGNNPTRANDWRPIGEFHDSNYPPQLAQEKCEAAARQLGINTDRYRCVRSK
jgi:hypothetical protein